MIASLPLRLAQPDGTVRRSARQGPLGRRRLREAGAAPKSPIGTASPPASAADSPPGRPGNLPLPMLVMAAALATLFAPFPAAAQKLDDRARAAAAAARAKTGDSDALQQNYLTPGLSGQPISTVDGSRTFNPTIACQKTASLLEVMVQPSSTGDLGLVQLSRDSDLDGTMESVSHLPVPVSGLCANGLVSCDPGTWNDCRFFRWDVGPDKALTLTAVDQSKLAGCYCLNNSCGANLAWANMPSVLRDLGGGMIGALTTDDPRYGVAQAVIDGPLIRYVGARSTACATDASLPQSSYRASPANMAADAYAASTGSQVFQTLKSSSIGAGTSLQYRHCTIERQMTVLKPMAGDIVSLTSGGHSVTQADSMIAFNLGSPVGNSLYGGSCGLIDFRMRLHVDRPDLIADARLGQLYADDWAQLRVDGVLVASGPSTWTSNGYPPGTCDLKGTFYAYPNTDLKPYLTAGDHEIWLRVAVGDLGRGFATVNLTLDNSCKVQEQLVDHCAAVAADSDCRIDTELVDGVQTFLNGVATGLKPLAQTRILGGTACPTEITRDFYFKDRTYSCKASETLQPDMSRGTYIIDHSTETLLADRARQGDGSFAATTRPFNLPDRGSVSSCEAICKTRAPKTNTDAAIDGVVGAKQNQPQGYDLFYHACTPDNRCPAGAGEEIVSDCGCLDDFPEAAGMMQTVRLAGADLVCTGTAR